MRRRIPVGKAITVPSPRRQGYAMEVPINAGFAGVFRHRLAGAFHGRMEIPTKSARPVTNVPNRTGCGTRAARRESGACDTR